jgi:hypothetical protein
MSVEMGRNITTRHTAGLSAMRPQAFRTASPLSRPTVFPGTGFTRMRF